MTELLLVRHALPVSGVADPELSEAGTAQAERLADWLACEPVEAIYVSPYRRTAGTAAPIERRLGLTARVSRDLSEWDCEIAERPPVYTPIEEIEPDDPRALALAEGRFEDFVPELDLAAFRARITRGLTAIMDAHPTGRVVAVSHGGLINTYLAMVIGAPRVFWFNPGYTSVSRVRRVSTGRTVVEAVNETAHLIGVRRAAPGGG